MIEYHGNSLVHCYWEAWALAEAIKRHMLPAECLATPPVFGERLRLDIVTAGDEMESVSLNLEDVLP